jgi:hypothetical protein
LLDIHSAFIYYVCGYPTMRDLNILNLLIFILGLYLYNWYTRETQPIDPFVLEGLPLFTIYSSRR